MISLEGQVHQEGQFNAHPRFENEESTEKRGMCKIHKYDKKVQKK